MTPTNDSDARDSSLKLSTATGIVVAGGLLGMTVIFYGWTGSTSIFSYIGERILEGGVPYRDGWDIKGPGIYFFYALAHGLFGPDPVAFRLLDLIWQCATALVLAAIAIRMYGRQSYGLVAGLSYVILYFSQNFWTMALTDSVLALPLALSFLFLYRALEDDRWWQWGFSAFWVGVASLFKLPFGMVGIAALWAAWKASPAAWRSTLRRWSWLAAGLAAAFALAAVYFWSKGGLSDLYEGFVLAAVAHSGRLRGETSAACLAFSVFQPVRYTMYAVGLLGLAGIFFPRGETEKRLRAKLLLVAWLAVTIIVFFLHAAYNDYHYLPALVPVVLLGIDPILRLAEFARASRWRKLAYVVFLLMLLVIPAEKSRQHAVFMRWRLAGGKLPSGIGDLIAFLRRETSPQDRIFAWGEVGTLYQETQRKSATRFITVYHLAISIPGTEYRNVFLSEFRANLPRYFILFKWKQPTGPCSETLVNLENAYYQFEELRSVVEANYRKVDETPKYVLYERI